MVDRREPAPEPPWRAPGPLEPAGQGLAREVGPVAQVARDAAYRGLADALVVSGVATGEPTPLADVRRVRQVVPDRPILVGSGVTPETVRDLLEVADGAIVGTWVKREGRTAAPVDPARAATLVRAAGT